MKEQQLIELLESVLGTSSLIRDGQEALFNCPSCKHHKRKLSVNLPTQKFQCWVCGFKGHRSYKILKKLNSSPSTFNRLKEIDSLYKFKTKVETKKESTINLPPEFNPIFPLGRDFTQDEALQYLVEERGLSKLDIVRYNIGYCDRGLYKDMIILPSYDNEGNLNYFVGRSFKKDSYIKHRQPKGANKDIIGFDLHINWDLPVILCESPLDAISIKRNAIPLYGKKIHDKLMIKLMSSNTKEIYIALDTDALATAFKYAEKLLSLGKKIFILDFGEKDPNETGFKNIIDILHNSQEITYSDILKGKLSLIR